MTLKNLNEVARGVGMEVEKDGKMYVLRVGGLAIGKYGKLAEVEAAVTSIKGINPVVEEPIVATEEAKAEEARVEVVEKAKAEELTGVKDEADLGLALADARNGLEYAWSRVDYYIKLTDKLRGEIDKRLANGGKKAMTSIANKVSNYYMPKKTAWHFRKAVERFNAYLEVVKSLDPSEDRQPLEIEKDGLLLKLKGGDNARK